MDQIRWPVEPVAELFHNESVIFRDWLDELPKLGEQARDNLEKIGMPEKSLVAELQIYGEHAGEIALDYGSKDALISDEKLIEEDKYVLSIFSRYLAERMKLIWDEENLNQLDKADGRLVSSTGQDSILDSIVTMAIELFGADNCLVRVKADDLYWVIKARIEGEYVKVGHSPLPGDIGICGVAISNMNAQFVVDAKSRSEFIKFSDYMIQKQDAQWMRRKDKIESVFVGVLLHSNKVIGTIVLEYYRKKDISRREQRLFRRFCNKAAIALYRTDELSRAIQNTGQILGIVGSALGHEISTSGMTFNMVVDDLRGFIQDEKEIEILDKFESVGSKLWDTVDLIKRLPYIRDINEICRAVTDIFSKSMFIKYAIKVTSGLDERIPEINSFDKAISIVFILMNLLSNAADALKSSDKSPRNLKIHTIYEPDNWRVLLIVEDNGCGIPASILPQLFDLGFSTDKSHSGMGLSLVRALAENLGGNVEVESVENEHTIFRIFIPWEDLK
jgi:hypothetical protein